LREGALRSYLPSSIPGSATPNRGIVLRMTHFSSPWP
jgi:hypothetical protein